MAEKKFIAKIEKEKPKENVFEKVDEEKGKEEYDAEVAIPAPEINSKETKRVKLDLEVDASAVDAGVNPYMKVIHLAKAIDAWRIFPRIFLTTYIVLLYKSVIWFMDLPDPSLEQSGLISVVVGAGAAWFGLYAGTRDK